MGNQPLVEFLTYSLLNFFWWVVFSYRLVSHQPKIDMVGETPNISGKPKSSFQKMENTTKEKEHTETKKEIDEIQTTSFTV